MHPFSMQAAIHLKTATEFAIVNVNQRELAAVRMWVSFAQVVKNRPLVRVSAEHNCPFVSRP